MSIYVLETRRRDLELFGYSFGVAYQRGCSVAYSLADVVLSLAEVSLARIYFLVLLIRQPMNPSRGLNVDELYTTWPDEDKGLFTSSFPEET